MKGSTSSSSRQTVRHYIQVLSSARPRPSAFDGPIASNKASSRPSGSEKAAASSPRSSASHDGTSSTAKADSRVSSNPSASAAPASNSNSITLAPLTSSKQRALAAGNSTMSASASSPGNATLTLPTPALTTTFTPPAECTQQHLTMLDLASSQIWLNEPLPVPHSTLSQCYPEAFVSSYLAAKTSTQAVVPAFSPLACPANYYTAFQQSFPDQPIYVACCPSGFALAPPASAPADRPAYGGRCISSLESASVTVTHYNSASSVGVTAFAAPATATNQAYAHLIDGFAGPATTGAATPSGAHNAAVAAATSTAHAAGAAVAAGSTSVDVSPALIAGVTVGAIAALSAVLAIATCCVRRVKRRRQERKMHFGMEGGGGCGSIRSSASVDEATLIAFPYGDPNRQPSGIRKITELHTSLDWAPGTAGADAAGASLPPPPAPPKPDPHLRLQNELRAAYMTKTARPHPSPPPPPPEYDDIFDLAAPEPAILQPPPRSPDRDVYARYPTPSTVCGSESESVSSLRPLRPQRPPRAAREPPPPPPLDSAHVAAPVRRYASARYGHERRHPGHQHLAMRGVARAHTSARASTSSSSSRNSAASRASWTAPGEPRSWSRDWAPNEEENDEVEDVVDRYVDAGIADHHHGDEDDVGAPMRAHPSYDHSTGPPPPRRRDASPQWI